MRNHKQALHPAAVHRPLPVAEARPLVVDRQNNLGCCSLDLREESTRAALGYCWQNMAERRCIELVHGLPVWLLRPSLYHGRVGDQDGDVGVL